MPTRGKHTSAHQTQSTGSHLQCVADPVTYKRELAVVLGAAQQVQRQPEVAFHITCALECVSCMSVSGPLK